jgi:S1-C subfamily serine protease
LNVGATTVRRGDEPRGHVRLAVAAVALACGFALSAEARTPDPALRAQGLDPCGWIGVNVSPMTAAFAKSLGMAEAYGAIFDTPEPGSPAARAGIAQGDVVIAINGVPIIKAADFATRISAFAPETIVNLNTYRDRQMIEVKLVLGSGKCPSPQHGQIRPPPRVSLQAGRSLQSPLRNV